MKPVSVVALIVYGVLASSNTFAQEHQRGGEPPQMQTFCATHSADCANLKALSEQAHSVCGNASSTVGACKEARERVHAQFEVLRSEGLQMEPRGEHGGGHGPE